MTRNRISRRLSVGAGLVVLLVLGWMNESTALPLYGSRSGRACDNCHTDPTGWKNPKLSKRKCNLSCMGCHVNPTGGGMRTVPGRFYSQSTMPMMYSSHRPFKDWTRHVAKALNYPKNRKNRLWDPAWATPFGGSTEMAFDQGRYAGLNADPLVQVGFDGRMAIWFPDLSPRALVFPMQLDLNLALHPYRYLTFFASGGVLSKSKGYEATFDPDRHTPFFMAKDVFVMAHQLPYMSYVRVGRFLPPFGIMYDDHTTPVRRDFEMDHGLSHSRVTGAEVGFAPNYPYFHFAAFRPNRSDRFVGSNSTISPDYFPPFFGVAGWGLAASMGWRDMGFQVGVSGMVRQRELEDGGDTESLALSLGFNPWYYLSWLPITYLGEIAMGRRQRAGSGKHTWQVAQLHELNYLAFNGVNFRVRYEFSDYDTEILNDHFHRFGFGVDLIVLPIMAIQTTFRLQKNSGPAADLSADGLIVVRVWY